MIKIIYFASLKEHVGRSEDQVALPEGLGTVGQLVDHLGNEFGQAWLDAIRASTTLIAVNQEMTGFDAAIQAGDEIAFFPPVTGG